MSLFQRQRQQQNPLGIIRSSYGYEENYGYALGNSDGNAIEAMQGGGGGDRSLHPMDAIYLDDSKTPLIPPYLETNTGDGGNDKHGLLHKNGSPTAAYSGGGKGGTGDQESVTAAEEADAAAGVSTAATSVLKRVTSLGAMVSSTSLSALAGLASKATSDEKPAGLTSSSRNSSPVKSGKPSINKSINNNHNKNLGSDRPFASSSALSNLNGNNSSGSTTMLNQYYQPSNDILNNPNHRNYHHHLYLRNMNMANSGNAPNPELPGAAASGGTLPPLPTEVKPSWRLRDRMKTVGIGLIMALNVGTDPPDIVKPHPSAKLQCWMDPSSVTRAKAKEKIGDRLEKQYARWQQQRNTASSARPFKYRKALDPTVEDVRALCLWLRKQARHERILLHYNGHGVPKPTPNGEIWVFDKNHTEYIPLSVSDLRQWVGKPTIVILDCSSAGVLVPFLTAPPAETPTNTPPRVSSPILAGSATSALEQQQQQQQQAAAGRRVVGDDDDPIITTMDEAASHWVRDTVVLCPTSEDEWLPMNPEYPADIFTSCLTTPIQMALRWFVRNNRISMGVLFGDDGGGGGSASGNQNQNGPTLGNDGPDIAVDAIPGQANDRKTPLGELNWIFTSVTDSIAWNGTCADDDQTASFPNPTNLFVSANSLTDGSPLSCVQPCFTLRLSFVVVFRSPSKAVVPKVVSTRPLGCQHVSQFYAGRSDLAEPELHTTILSAPPTGRCGSSSVAGLGFGLRDLPVWIDQGRGNRTKERGPCQWERVGPSFSWPEREKYTAISASTGTREPTALS